MEYKTTILDELALSRTIKRLSHEIIEHNNGVNDLILVGIKTRGVPFARIIKDNLKALEGVDVVHVMIPFALGRATLREARKRGIPVTAGFHCQAENFTSHLNTPNLVYFSRHGKGSGNRFLFLFKDRSS